MCLITGATTLYEMNCYKILLFFIVASYAPANHSSYLMIMVICHSLGAKENGAATLRVISE